MSDHAPAPAFVIAAFYHFFDFPDFEAMQAPLLARLQDAGIKGSLLITREGVNSTLSGTRKAIDGFLGWLQDEVVGAPIRWKESYADFQPFGKARVRLKKETISLGEPVSMRRFGQYVDPADWNALIQRDDVVIVDTRNDYEVNLGTFRGAIDPDIPNFKHLPQWTHDHADALKGRKIATFCTGGIRCEKYTAWLIDQGFEEVYHLKGGILQYLEDVKPEDSLWQGECFVFDERIAVDHQLQPSRTATLCLHCDHALTAEDQAHPAYVQGQSCPHCLGAPLHAHNAPKKHPAGRTKF
ncbi:rhodanese-related sulfurtransferase [Asticcacaulis sp. EMRT-3]|uniref:oxygen-dependent tRNA uridine(34) hydroxylase TrhO n=1 Tax=Asticcacaulis sp. EMRT-3 TaxID=3040349 RepID=UPI0024AF8D62|nr:rhodanese-related sulfurtransferase [Asticcacaulis sp. EMRT-3]MDI7774450.1 rhodanese-related sulfurtransferase [Asticcacaulis sp. EMRT-3]